MSARTILNPPLINELNGLFDGTTSIDVLSIESATTISADGDIGTAANMSCVSLSASGTISADGDIGTAANVSCVSLSASGNITANEFIVDGNSSTSTPSITTNSANNFVVSTASNSGLTISSSSGNATFTPGASGVSVNNGITASTFTTSVGGTSTFDDVSIEGTLTCSSTVNATELAINGGIINAFVLVSITGMPEIPAGSGSGATPFAGYVQENVLVSSSPTASASNFFVFANSAVVSVGGIIINGVSVQQPTNGTAGYCNLTFTMSNLSESAITPEAFQVLLLSY